MNRNKKLLKKVIAAGLCTAMAVNTAAAVYAADASAVKDENVYVTLGQDGSVSGIYVINEFSSEEGGEISDYGDYSSLKNLTDQSEISMENGHITADMPKGKFYYQGNLDSGELPWDISISYFFDGEKISADELAGKSGDLKIVIQTKENPDGNEVFFDNYLLQATAVLNTEKCSDIRAEGATAGNVGINRQLVYTILPGEEKEIEITAKVQEFEMSGITFQGIPMSLGISEDMLDNMELTDQTKELTDAVVLLDDGVGELKKGTEAAADGGVQLAQGITELAKGTGALKTGGSALTQGTSSLAGGTKTLQSGVGQYTDGVDSFAAGVEQYVAGVEMLAQGVKQLEPLENLSLMDDAVVQLYQAVAVGNQQQGVPSLQEGAKSLSDGLHMILEQVKLLEDSTDAEKLQEMIGALAQLQAMTEQLSGSLGEISDVIGESADMIGAVEASHQAVLAGLNTQVDEANRQISESGKKLAENVNVQIDKNNVAVDQANEKIAGVNGQINSVNAQIDAVNGKIAGSVSSVNAQIDQAIASIRASVAGGVLDEAAASNAIASLEASKVQAETVDKISGAGIGSISKTEHVEAPQVSVSEIQMPEEDASVQAAIQGLKDVSAGLKEAEAQFDTASEQFSLMADSMASSIPSAEGNPIAQLSQALSSASEGADALNAGVNGVGDALKQLSQSTSSFGEAGEGIKALSAGVDELCMNNSLLLEGSKSLKGAKGDLVSGTAALAAGTAELNSGALVLAQGISALHQGASLLNDNTGTLTSGLAELDEGTGKLKEGTEEFREQTDNMDEKIREEIEKLLNEMSGDEFEPVSFTSEKNTNIGLVQFAITADGIRIQEAEEETVEEEEEGFTDRLKRLFQ